MSVDYASTIHRAQGATVDEAHLLLAEHTNAEQLYVAATRGRTANHVHTHRPAFDAEHHGPTLDVSEWSPADAVIAALRRDNAETTALARRRQLRNEIATSRDPYVIAPSAGDRHRPVASRMNGNGAGRTL